MGRRRTGAYAVGLHRGGPKKGLQTSLQDEIVQEIEALLGRQAIQDLDFEALETAARRQALRLAARALEQRLNADTSDHIGPELTCSCGAAAQYHDRHPSVPLKPVQVGWWPLTATHHWRSGPRRPAKMAPSPAAANILRQIWRPESNVPIAGRTFATLMQGKGGLRAPDSELLKAFAEFGRGAEARVQ